MLFFFLFLSFVQVGLLSYGGSEGSLALLQHEIVEQHHWLTSEEFAQLLAVSNVLPGDFAVQFAAYTGIVALTGMGFWAVLGGSLTATVSVALPSVFWSECHAWLRNIVSNRDIKESMLTLLRPLAPGIVLAAILMLCTHDIFGSPNEDIWDFIISIFLFVSTLTGITVFRIKPLAMLLLCGVAGIILF